MGVRIALVPGGKTKLNKPAFARDFYCSALFKRSRELAERDYDAWFILSGLHHVVEPGAHIVPYSAPMPRHREACYQWGLSAVTKLLVHLPTACDIDLFAGNSYDRVTVLRVRAGHRVHLPMTGLKAGSACSGLMTV